MNNDDTFTRNSGDLSPELEARVVAWVLGEASAFEAAQLDVLCAQQPELAVFKRRLEAVHGLVGEAVKPLKTPLLLSPERRAKVLAVIGVSEKVKTDTAKKDVIVFNKRKRTISTWRRWQGWIAPMAACLTVGLIVLITARSGSEQIIGKKKIFERQESTGLIESRKVMDEENANPRAVEHRLQVARKGGGTAQPMGNGLGLAPIPEGYSRAYQGGTYPQSYGGVQSTVGYKDNARSLETVAAATVVPPSPPSAAPMSEAPAEQSAKQLPDAPSVQVTSGFALGDNLSVGVGEKLKHTGSAFGGAVAVVRADGYADADKPDLRSASSSAEMRDRKKPAISPAADPFAAPAFEPERGVIARLGKEIAASNNTAVTSGSTSMVDSFAPSAPIPTTKRQKLDRIIPQIAFENMPLSRVISSLTVVSAEQDRSTEDGGGTNIVVQDPENKDPNVTITLRNLSLERVLDLITESIGYRYDIKDNLVVVRPKLPTDLDVFFFPVTRAVMVRIMKASEEEQTSRDESAALRTLFQKEGVDFSASDALVVYDGAAVIVKQTTTNIERIRAILKRYQDEQEAEDNPDFDVLRSEISTANESVSTFSLHVSDASFRLAKAALERGQAPDAATIRPEEFYNAFDYGDPSPAAGEAVSCRVEQAAHPFLQQRNLVRIAMKVPAAGRGAGQPLRLTVMLDTSGSMEREDRAATVRAALTALTSLLGPDDRVTLVGFARTPTLLAEGVPGDQAAKIIELAARTPAEGGTNLEEALALAGKLAMRQKLATAQNRIVLLTDGAANLGDADPQALAKRVEALRQNGIAFDACGVVADGLDDSVLEALTRKGDGRYAVVNSPEEADANFARQLAGAFRPAAKDVKVQVHFNPARVARYRLVGFEKHRLKTEDFRNDKVDAAELAAEEAAVAVYQVEVLPEGEGELGEVAVRFLDTRSNERVERSWTLAYSAQPAAFARATPSLQLAGSAAFVAEKLRGGALAGQVRLDEFAPVVEGLGAAYPNAPRVREFIQMFRQTRRLTGE